MLIVGHPGLFAAETRSHLAAWAVIAAPLGISFDLVQGPQDEGLLALLTISRVLAVNQDSAGIAGVRATAANATGGECWAKPLRDGGAQTSAVLLFNRGSGAADVACQWSDVLPHLPGGARARVVDLWEGTDLGTFAGGFTARALESHASMLVAVTPV
jgi:alpha-galactosidase